MRVFSILVTAFIFNLASANGGMGEKFCSTQAETFFKGYHARVLDEVGVIQGYFEEIDLKYSQKVVDMDNRYETYHYSVVANNDEGDWWVWEYKVNVDAWLTAGGSDHNCDDIKMVFLGVTETSPEN